MSKNGSIQERYDRLGELVRKQIVRGIEAFQDGNLDAAKACASEGKLIQECRDRALGELDKGLRVHDKQEPSDEQ